VTLLVPCGHVCGGGLVSKLEQRLIQDPPPTRAPVASERKGAGQSGDQGRGRPVVEAGFQGYFAAP
jgi:hypothetical protein